MPEGTLTQFTECDAYRYCGAQLFTSQSRSCIEYLKATNNIIVLD